jgi:hypothetical protein
MRFQGSGSIDFELIQPRSTHFEHLPAARGIAAIFVAARTGKHTGFELMQPRSIHFA